MVHRRSWSERLCFAHEKNRLGAVVRQCTAPVVYHRVLQGEDIYLCEEHHEEFFERNQEDGVMIDDDFERIPAIQEGTAFPRERRSTMSEKDARAILQRELDELQNAPIPQVHGASYRDKFTRGLNDQARAVHAARVIEVERLLAQLGSSS